MTLSGPSAAARMAIRGRALRLGQARGPCATARTGQETECCGHGCENQ